MSVWGIFGEKCLKAEILHLGAHLLQKCQKSERYRVSHSQKRSLIPSLYSAVLRNVTTGTIWGSPVHHFRPRSRLNAASFQKGVWGEQRLSSGVLGFRSLWITWEGGKRREPSGSCGALAVHKHRVQASHFGSEESVNTVKHSEKVRELQLLKIQHRYSCYLKLKYFLQACCFAILHNMAAFSIYQWITFASIDLESWFWNKNLILLFPSSDDPFSWENLYLHSTAWNVKIQYKDNNESIFKLTKYNQNDIYLLQLN